MNRETHDSSEIKKSFIDMLNNKQLRLCMRIYYGRTYLAFDISIPIRDHTKK